MSEPLKHTKGPWFSGHNDMPEPEYLVSCPETGGMIALVPRQHDARLIGMATTAPHVCEYRQCPGDINRRKLEMFGELVAMLNRILSYAPAKSSQERHYFDEAWTLLAQAKELMP